ncbi:MAG: hypothetical protein WKH64_15410 [Chloroflexia bacterium]
MSALDPEVGTAWRGRHVHHSEHYNKHERDRPGPGKRRRKGGGDEHRRRQE